MEIYEIVLMVIGAITLVWLVYKTVKGFFWLLGVGMASCFREKYPYDFIVPRPGTQVPLLIYKLFVVSLHHGYRTL